MNNKDKHPVRIKRELVHHGSIVDFYTDTMKLPDGREEIFDFIKHRGAAAVIPVMDDGKILMVRQHRNAIDDYTLEIPAGGLETPDEPTQECAYRELEEETGYYADRSDVTFLIAYYSAAAYCSEKIDIYVARNLTRTGQHLDDDEYIDVYAYTIDELTQMVFEGKIKDGKTIAGLMSYRAKFCEE